MNELQQAVDRMMTCARAYACSHEEACFQVIMWAREQLNRLESPEDSPVEIEVKNEQPN